ncbi:uncharacterized protein VTP21DRAFT_7566 [Calcarisporiella thermophila]|uniref:uncharacterized protein n=1 Tax=Calcarisporiella thermophila TaxID=911321 RepID=UPI0037432541
MTRIQTIKGTLLRVLAVGWMALVGATASGSARSRSVGELLLDNFAILDVTGPVQMLMALPLYLPHGTRPPRSCVYDRIVYNGPQPHARYNALDNVPVISEFGCNNAPLVDLYVIPGGPDAFTSSADLQFVSFARKY